MIELAGFLIGVQMTILLFASLYRVIDLWYCIRDYWIHSMARIALYAAVIALVYYLGRSPDDNGFSHGFFYGQLFFAVFHITIFWIGRLQLLFMKHFL